MVEGSKSITSKVKLDNKLRKRIKVLAQDQNITTAQILANLKEKYGDKVTKAQEQKVREYIRKKATSGRLFRPLKVKPKKSTNSKKKKQLNGLFNSHIEMLVKLAKFKNQRMISKQSVDKLYELLKCGKIISKDLVEKTALYSDLELRRIINKSVKEQSAGTIEINGVMQSYLSHIFAALSARFSISKKKHLYDLDYKDCKESHSSFGIDEENESGSEGTEEEMLEDNSNRKKLLYSLENISKHFNITLKQAAILVIPASDNPTLKAAVDALAKTSSDDLLVRTVYSFVNMYENLPEYQQMMNRIALGCYL